MDGYRAYAEYKDTNPKWIGYIPKHWHTIRIKFTTYVKGRVGWHGLNSSEFLYDGDYYLVTGTDFVSRTIKWSTCYRISEERYEEDPYIQLREGDLLISKDGTIGKVAQAKDIPYKASVNSGVFVTRPLEGHPYCTDYMYYVLISDVFTEFIENQKTGTTISHLYQNVFENFEYPLPPTIDEQQTIARFLDYKTAQIDALVAKKETLLTKLAEKRTALISHAVTKGLDPTVPMKDSGIEWLGEIPAHWDTCYMKRVAKVSYGVGGEIDRGLIEGTNLLSLPNVTKDGTLLVDEVPLCELTEAEKKEALLQKGDLLFNWRNGSSQHLGKTAYFDLDGEWTHVSFLLKLRFDLNTSDSHYFQYMLTGLRITGFFISSKAGVNNTFNLNELMNLWIINPPKEEQQAISNYLDIQTLKIDDMTLKLRAAIDKLKEYRTALITNAVTGKIDVRNVPVPAPTPAEVSHVS